MYLSRRQMNKIQHLAFGLLSLGLLAACTGEQSSTNDRDSVALLSDTTLMEDRVPFRLAEHYFAAADSLPATLLSAEEQEQYMATTMSARPTPIDWSREFVIPIVLPATGVSTEIVPLSLQQRTPGELVLSYRVVRGADLKGAQMRPFAAVIVSRDYLAPVRLVERP